MPCRVVFEACERSRAACASLVEKQDAIPRVHKEALDAICEATAGSTVQKHGSFRRAGRAAELIIQLVAIANGEIAVLDDRQ